jgi:hypothetical protein
MLHVRCTFDHGSGDPPVQTAGRLASLGVRGLPADRLGIRAVYYLGGVLLLLAAVLAPLARPDSGQAGGSVETGR